MLAFFVPGDSGQYLVRVRFTLNKGRKGQERKEKKRKGKGKKRRLIIICLDGICKKKIEGLNLAIYLASVTAKPCKSARSAAAGTASIKF